MTTEQPVEWLVVGGGIHGVHMAIRLMAQAGVARKDVTIVDPGDRLLDAWRRCTKNTGMTHLRSPAVHHLGLTPFELLKFSGANCRGRGANKGDFVGPYARPSVSLFQAHCEALIEKHSLARQHVRDRVTHIKPHCDTVTVTLQSGRILRAQRVVLALGASEQPRWPAWATQLKEDGVNVQQLFEPGFSLHLSEWPERVAVIGGGISAVQAALRFADSGRQVTLFARHGFRKHDFDSDSGWVGPKKMRSFGRVLDLAERRALIQGARHAGSVPPHLYRTIKRAVTEGTVQHFVTDAHPIATDDALAVRMDDVTVEFDGIVLATGFEAHRPGGALVDQLVQTHSLPCADCGYPVVDTHLRWHPRVFVTGPLAELELGPVSRNIAGARRAAERIMPIAMAS